MSLSDEQLMLQVSKGDQKAFEELFIRYKSKVLTYIVRMCGNQAVAEEIFQEVFLRLYRFAPQYKALAKFSTFLYRIATNLCINELKRKKRFSVFSLTKVEQGDPELHFFNEQSIVSAEKSPEELVLSAELQQHLQKAVNQLPGQMRATLILSELEGKRYDEIAAILECSVGTIKSRINRSRTKILTYLSKHDIL